MAPPLLNLTQTLRSDKPYYLLFIFNVLKSPLKVGWLYVQPFYNFNR